MKNLLLVSIALISFFSNAQVDSVNVNDCSYRTNEVDEFTGSSKVVMNEELFISHTDSSLVKYYKRKKHQYFEVECYAAKIDKLYALYFYVTIQTKKAYDYYGSLSSDSKIILKFDDESTLTLKVSKSDYGDTDYDKNQTIYSTYCIVDKDDVELLKNNAVQKVRMYWSKGYEDYECDDGELLMRQFTCLN